MVGDYADRKNMVPALDSDDDSNSMMNGAGGVLRCIGMNIYGYGALGALLGSMHFNRPVVYR